MQGLSEASVGEAASFPTILMWDASSVPYSLIGDR
jgi:hypothetical protein